jgi:hypothetical protein
MFLFSSRANRRPNSSSSINRSDEKTSPRAVRRILPLRPPDTPNPLPWSSHAWPPRHRGSRPERDAPVRLHTIRTRARGLAGRTKHGARRRHPSCGWQVDGPQAEVPALYSAWASYPRSRTRGVGRSRSRQRTGDVAGPVQRRLSDRRGHGGPCAPGSFPWGRSRLSWVLLTVTSPSLSLSRKKGITADFRRR